MKPFWYNTLSQIITYMPDSQMKLIYNLIFLLIIFCANIAQMFLHIFYSYSKVCEVVKIDGILQK
jgi:hypothetical protein